ncbi:hypothetical protein ACN38_g1845 [Penicillium nordicum]|uniref:Uncharacterized protein n=1 Tax=Penicillium nordicum TaxID=229535 RepID=A0A0M8PAY1_9EURO|nr:hypothetical protein ACN38_g1845 [Penicillium nordicum]
MEEPSAIAREYTSELRPKGLSQPDPLIRQRQSDSTNGYGQELDRNQRGTPTPTLESLLIRPNPPGHKLLTTWGSGFSTKGF